MSQATIDQLADNVPTAEVYQHPIHRLRVALITGQLASSIMLLLMMAVSLVSGDGAFYPLRVIGSMALGDRAMTGDGTFPIAIGLLLNQFALTLRVERRLLGSSRSASREGSGQARVDGFGPRSGQPDSRREHFDGPGHDGPARSQHLR
jgi:hypothetical protein